MSKGREFYLNFTLCYLLFTFVIYDSLTAAY